MYSQSSISTARKKLGAALGLDLRDYSLGEVEEFSFRLREVDWSPGSSAVISSLPEEVQRYITNELLLSRIDFRYWAERYCKILGADKQMTTLSRLWASQEKILKVMGELEDAGPKMKLILLKSRQIGGTAIAEALVAHSVFLQPRTQAIVGSDHPDNTLKLWQTLMRIYDGLPKWMQPLRDGRTKAQNLHLSELDSDIVYGSGNQRTTLGQGMTVDVAHLSEISTWIQECTMGIDADLIPAFDSSEKHHSFLFLESTASGAHGNWFHDQFQAALRGRSDFRPIFIAWYLRPGWKRSAEGVEFDETTRAMAERVRRETSVELSREQLSWWQFRRAEAREKNELEIFYQEFPSTVEEAFQTGLKSAFSLEVRSRVRDSLKVPQMVFEVKGKERRALDLKSWLANESTSKYENCFMVWEKPTAGSVYVIGVDASYGIDGGDNAAVEVLRVGTRNRPDEQVGEWCGNISPLALADVCWLIGHFFNDKLNQTPAMMAIEVNPGSPGIVTQTELLKRHYPNFFIWRRPLRMDNKRSREVGWWTTPRTRPLLTERGVNYIRKGDLLINSVPFVAEMGNYVDRGREGFRHWEHAPGTHDDRIMALFIALEASHSDDVGNVAEERRKAMELRTAAPPQAVQFQALGLSWEEALGRWETQVDLD